MYVCNYIPDISCETEVDVYRCHGKLMYVCNYIPDISCETEVDVYRQVLNVV